MDELTKNLSGTAAQSPCLESLLKATPLHQGDEADQDMDRHAPFETMKARSQTQNTLGAPKGLLGLGSLDLPAPP